MKTRPQARAVSTLVRLPETFKKAIVLCVDAGFAVFTTWLAFCLRLDQLVELSPPLIWAAVLSVCISLPIFIKLGLYRAIYRYTGWYATKALVLALAIYAGIYFLIIFVLRMEGIPRSVGVIQPMLLLIFVGLSRLLAKWFLNYQVMGGTHGKPAARVLIYGAGGAGRQLASGLMQGVGIRLAGFVDDNPKYWKRTINGLLVYAPDEIPGLLNSGAKVTDVLLAMPSVSRARQREIMTGLADLPVHVRTLPALNDLAHGIVQVEDVRKVDIGDVLGREPVEPNIALMHQNIKNKVVLVTGAGGSIGSELCRQVLEQDPSLLVLFELSEFALYTIERELSQLAKPLKIVPVLGSVLDGNKLQRIMRDLKVQTVYHAAAYKHVPMIEMNPAAGVWNNVFGTLRAVEAACQTGVETFVLVSTDKAVRPTNVMGCSKRLAELVLQAKSLQERSLGVYTTKLTMVRFGNVLGSSGSVVPVFREQIKLGGPVTVTHPEITRYFMTIPEAAQLVIQAGAMGDGGDVMVLDMGDPIKVIDLAKRMIHLSGFSHQDESNPDGDIEIKFTGLRPGEKLYEELLIGNNTLPTSHLRIMRAEEQALTWEALEPILIKLEKAVKAEDADAIWLLLKKAVAEFEPLWEGVDVVSEPVAPLAC